MSSLNNLVTILAQLKAAPKHYNLSEADIYKIDKAIEEIGFLESQKPFFNKEQMALEIISLINLIAELFGNSS